MFESTIDKVRAAYLFNALFSFLYIAYNGIGVKGAILSFFIFFLMNGVGVVIGYHRYYSHKSFEFKYKFIKIIVLLFGTLSCSGSALGWSGIHREHHKFSDTDRDPHSASRGFWAMLSLNYSSDFSPRMVVDLYKDRLVMWFHTYYFIPIAIYAVFLYFYFGLEGLVIALCIPAFLSVSAEGATNYINHKDKDEYKASNVWWMNFFSFGDGWHKNHHESPTSWTTKERWYQFDPCGFVIGCIKR